MKEQMKKLNECVVIALEAGLRKSDPWRVSVCTRSRPWLGWSTHQTVFVGYYADAEECYKHLVGEA